MGETMMEELILLMVTFLSGFNNSVKVILSKDSGQICQTDEKTFRTFSQGNGVILVKKTWNYDNQM